MTEWAETLPESCPPADALQPNEIMVFRVVGTIPPTEKDFYSNRKLFPEKDFGIDECTARAISVFNKKSFCVRAQKMPIFKDKKTNVVKLVLKKESGLIKKTFGRHHFSFWAYTSFNPIGESQAV